MGLVVFHLVVALLGSLFKSATRSTNLNSTSNNCSHHHHHHHHHPHHHRHHHYHHFHHHHHHFHAPSPNRCLRHHLVTRKEIYFSIGNIIDNYFVQEPSRSDPFVVVTHVHPRNVAFKWQLLEIIES